MFYAASRRLPRINAEYRNSSDCASLPNTVRISVTHIPKILKQTITRTHACSPRVIRLIARSRDRRAESYITLVREAAKINAATANRSDRFDLESRHRRYRSPASPVSSLARARARDLFSRRNYAELVSEGSFQFALLRMRSNLD